MTNEELDKMLEERVKQKEQEALNTSAPVCVEEKSLMINQATNIVQEQQQKDIDNFKDTEDFKKASRELAERKVLGEFKKEALAVLDGDLKNQYQEYVLKKEKERLDYIMENEKPLIKEKAKADLMEQKIKIAEQRYGYLYQRVIVEDIDDKGNKIQKVVYKDFTPSKFLNVLKELASKYKNLSQTTRSAILTTLKIIFGVGISVLVIWLGYKGISALLHSGFIQLTPQ